MPGWERYDARAFHEAASRLGITLPATWLRALPNLWEVIGNDDASFELGDAEILERDNKGRRDEDTDYTNSKRWLEIGGDGCGNLAQIDLESPAMPHDAEVIYWSHDDEPEVQRRWPSVVDFVAEMTQFPEQRPPT